MTLIHRIKIETVDDEGNVISEEIISEKRIVSPMSIEDIGMTVDAQSKILEEIQDKTLKSIKDLL